MKPSTLIRSSTRRNLVGTAAPWNTSPPGEDVRCIRNAAEGMSVQDSGQDGASGEEFLRNGLIFFLKALII